LIGPYIDKYNLRWFSREVSIKDVSGEYYSTTRNGIIAPMSWMGEVKSYQIRYFTSEKSMRFHTMDGVKLLYFTTTPEMGDDITLCEGIYDAHACHIMGFPNPVALLGKSLTNLQSNQLRNLCPRRLHLCLDDYICNGELAKGLRKKLPTLMDIKFYSWKGEKDPEEYLRRYPTETLYKGD
jgi:hypothetical protein